MEQSTQLNVIINLLQDLPSKIFDEYEKRLNLQEKSQSQEIEREEMIKKRMLLNQEKFQSLIKIIDAQMGN